jgi:hypothetical protein
MRKKTKSNHQDVENVDILSGTCFFKMPPASPARSTSVEFVESVPGTDGSDAGKKIIRMWKTWRLYLVPVFSKCPQQALRGRFLWNMWNPYLVPMIPFEVGNPSEL